MTTPSRALVEDPLARHHPVSFAIFALARQHRALAAALLADCGLFPGQELILMQLWEQDGRSQKQLVEALKLDHSTIAKSVRRLENSGLVVRTADESDARVKVVSLTAEGRALEERTKAKWRELEEATTRGLTEQERRQFVALAAKVVDQLG
ncbi:MarR family winged helix-turn-helix transcriptional regulator [Saccharothrix coeruleofusca]|uniref:MarR family transcriptional regulator n=1 Tax=Saccharothrix coeruleofusca TaxID=33919 RepID=A0A918APT0_9PSEU|nr:MarR family transcriptional regulator [Saccharothrix coeruleofusca]MBP2334980.1 DNA-binding MarR family transcriptional regulator [Saccharothrix coeruleofusca]GGP68364.1 MarR family transcriptional regulator [Saccharothrix coeruleofusca]